MDALAAESLIPPPLSSAETRPATVPGRIRRASGSRLNVAFLSLIWIGLVGLVDYWTGYEHTMLIFYLIPITLGTWFVSRGYGMFLAALSIATSIFTDIASGIPEVRYWNELVGLSSYVVFVWLLARWRNLLLQLDDRVRLRTADLQEEILQRMRLEREMAEVTERERLRLGHDLHDSLCQHLTGVALTAQALQSKLIGKQIDDAIEAGKLVDLIEEGIDLTRSLARGLFSPDLERGGLAVALEGLAHNTQERTGISCEFHHNDEECAAPCDSVVATQLYRIAQEAAANAIKHSRATRIVIELDRAADETRLNIFDDGVGFDTATETKGLGLKMMRNGADLIGAQFQVSPRLPVGTTVSCILTNREPDET
jgi:signal transduction histidine kinase